MSEVKVPDEPHEAALCRWMNDYGDMLVRLAYGILGDSFLAQDAVQDTFVKAYKNSKLFRSESSDKTYLTSILVNTCRDYLRTAWMKRIDRKISLDQLPEPYMDASVPDRTVIEAVLKLPLPLRQVILLRHWQNMRIKEVGEALSVSPETVKKRLKRANQKLQTQLEGWYFDE